jgi:5-methyltetrahydrofolate--homocysteine methyltransferase
MEQILKNIFDDVVNGSHNEIEGHMKAALEKDLPAETILNESLVAAMADVGKKFEIGEFFVPEMLISARAMKSGMAILKPLLVKNKIKPIGKVVLGTAKGDLHDIGKNLVGLMLEGAGFEVIDAGSDVSPDKFLEFVMDHQPDILGMSALLTTTMVNMRETITALEKNGIRGSIKIMIGGAPVTAGYATQIGADGFAEDASKAVKLARDLLNIP